MKIKLTMFVLGTGWSTLEPMTAGGGLTSMGASKIFATLGAAVGCTTRSMASLETTEMVAVTFGISNVA